MGGTIKPLVLSQLLPLHDFTPSGLWPACVDGRLNATCLASSPLPPLPQPDHLLCRGQA